MIDFKLLINPYERIAGWPSIIIGLACILSAGFIAGINGAHFSDLVSVLYTASTGIYVPVLELVLTTFFLITLSWISCLIARANFRIIDLIGTILLSRSPYLILALGGYLSDLGLGHQVWQAIILPFILINISWSLVLLFHALKVTANLKGKQLWAVFLFTTLSSELLSLLLINKFYLIIL